MKKLVIIFSVILSISACEPVHRAEIKNSRNKPVVLEITFDRDSLKKYWNGRSYIGYLKSYPNNGEVTEIAFDSNNLTKTFTIEPNTNFPLESGIGSYPDYSLIKQISIIGKDTVSLINNEAVVKAFIKTDKRTWVLNLK